MSFFDCESLAANGDKIRKFNVSYFVISVDPLEGVMSERGFANRWRFYIDKRQDCRD